MKARRPLLILLLAVLAVAAWYWDRFRTFAEAPLPDGLHPDAAIYQAMGARFAAAAFAEGGPFGSTTSA